MMTPTGKTHLLAALIVGIAISVKFGLSALHIAVAMLGGLFPDTDVKRSLMGRFVWLWLIFKPHRRNILHSPLGAVLLSLLLCIITLPSYAFAFFCGYMSHLVLDMFNASGIPFFYPKKKMISVARIKVGGFGELMLLFGFYMMIIALFTVW